DTVIALTGADMQATLDGEPVARYATVPVKAGQVLALGKVQGNGARAYLAVAGGLQCPTYLGSRSTFTLGQFGGHAGRAIRTGDVLHLAAPHAVEPASLPPAEYPDVVELRVLYGPHGAPDFFTDGDIAEFFSSIWKVHYNSSRTGVRLIGPKPVWARPSGGEAGMHPSNIHDNAYAFGTVDFTGDMPVILGPDGPSLGGFVCPATVITADLWILGQLSAGTAVKFVPVSLDTATAEEAAQQEAIKALRLPAADSPVASNLVSPIVLRMPWENDELVCRIAGDHFLLIEVGPLVLDIPRRFRVHALMLALAELAIPGVRELTPGIRSLQVHYDSQQLPLRELLAIIENTASNLSTSELTVPSRAVWLPLSWDDEACQLAIRRYIHSVRADA